jgi:hypothetical protein
MKTVHEFQLTDKTNLTKMGGEEEGYKTKLEKTNYFKG